ncbi:MAG: hypothetical protein IJ014_00565 [Rikenellaceae bacterium]|nr:hypothetical protein [Rikenellaceae bacterium]
MKRCLLILIGAAITACVPKQAEVRTVRGIILDAYAESVMIQENDSVTSWITLSETTDLSECDGLAAGGSVAAECKVEPTNTGDRLTAIKVIAPDMPYEHYIIGSWVEPNPVAPDQVQGFTLEADGSAHSINTSEVTYTSWTLRGNQLVLVAESTDDSSFEQQIIYRIKGISSQKLTLENEEGTESYIYSRH